MLLTTKAKENLIKHAAELRLRAIYSMALSILFLAGAVYTGYNYTFIPNDLPSMILCSVFAIVCMIFYAMFNDMRGQVRITMLMHDG